MPDAKNTPNPKPTPPSEPPPSAATAGDLPESGAPSDPVPTASVEPEAQVTASMTHPLDDVADASAAGPAAGEGTSKKAAAKPSHSGDGSPDLLPPSASYELPDEYAGTWLDGARQWVEEHPALAVAAAAGVGLVIGRLVMALAPEPEPSLVGKVERRAKVLGKDLRRETKGLMKDARSALKDVRLADTSEAVQSKLRRAAEAISEAADSVAGRAAGAVESGAERTRDLADTLSDAVKAAVSGAVAKKADEWVGKMRR